MCATDWPAAIVRATGAGFAKTTETLDPDGAALTTTYSHIEGPQIPGDPAAPNARRLRQMVGPDGYWELYEYDSNGRLTKTVSQFQGSSLYDELGRRIGSERLGIL